MAKYIGLLSTDMRGKIGGTVASRGRTGTVLKAKGTPRVAPSPAQNQQRVVIAQSLYAWRALTTTQQQSWGSIAASQVWTNSLGSAYVPTGLQLYTQAFSNAAFLDSLPPATCGGSPSLVAPIAIVYLEATGDTAVMTVAPSFGDYSGAWLGFLSAPISASLNYTKTLAKRFVGGNLGGATNYYSVAYAAAFGRYPQSEDRVAVRAVPIDPTYYYSGTAFNTVCVVNA